MALQLDVLIIGPGGLLPNKAPGKIAFFILLALLMRLRKKKIGFVGIGIGSANLSNALCIMLLNLLFFISSSAVIRHSLEGKMQLWKPNRDKVQISLDYLLSDHDAFQGEKKNGSETNVVFSLANIFDREENERRLFVDTICEVINHLLEKSMHVTLIGLSRKADSDLNLEISDRLGGSRVTCLTYGEDNST